MVQINSQICFGAQNASKGVVTLQTVSSGPMRARQSFDGPLTMQTAVWCSKGFPPPANSVLTQSMQNPVLPKNETAQTNYRPAMKKIFGLAKRHQKVNKDTQAPLTSWF